MENRRSSFNRRSSRDCRSCDDGTDDARGNYFFVLDRSPITGKQRKTPPAMRASGSTLAVTKDDLEPHDRRASSDFTPAAVE